MVVALARYREMVERSKWLLTTPKGRQFWSQQDGVTFHTARETTDCLTAVSTGRNILRFGDSAWPARFPDLTALGYVSSDIL